MARKDSEDEGGDASSAADEQVSSAPNSDAPEEDTKNDDGDDAAAAMDVDEPASKKAGGASGDKDEDDGDGQEAEEDEGEEEKEEEEEEEEGDDEQEDGSTREPASGEDEASESAYGEDSEDEITRRQGSSRRVSGRARRGSAPTEPLLELPPRTRRGRGRGTGTGRPRGRPPKRPRVEASDEDGEEKGSGASGSDGEDKGTEEGEDGEGSGSRGRGRGRGGARGGRRRGRPPKSRPTMRFDGGEEEFEDEQSDTPSEHDPRGDEKIDKDGQLLGNREYKFRTFRLPRHPTKYFMFTIDAARSLGYRDSFLFYAKNKDLPKLLAREEDKDHLVEMGLLIPQLKTRNINLIPARALFKKFGHRCVKRGIPVRDDYFVGDKPEPDENEYWDSLGKEEEEEEEVEFRFGEATNNAPTWRTNMRRNEGIVKDLIENSMAGIGGAGLEAKEPGEINQTARNRMARMVVAANEVNDRLTQERIIRASQHHFEVNTRQPLHPVVYTSNIRFQWEMEVGSNNDPTRKISIETEPVERSDDPTWVPLVPSDDAVKYPLAIDAGQYQANFSIFTHRFGHESEPIMMPPTAGQIVRPPLPQHAFAHQPPPGQFGAPGMPGYGPPPMGMGPGGPIPFQGPGAPGSQQKTTPIYSHFCGVPTNHGQPCRRPVSKAGEKCLYHNKEAMNMLKAGSPMTAMPGIPPNYSAVTPIPEKRGPGRPPKNPQVKMKLPVCEVCETEQTPARLDTDTTDEPMPNLMLLCSSDKLHRHAYCAEASTPAMIAKVITYPWECSDCKLCCVCRKPGDEESVLLCDSCDRGYHMECLDPKVESLPEGSWLCPICALCRTCGRQSAQKPLNGALAAEMANRKPSKEPDVTAENLETEFHHATVPTPEYFVAIKGRQTYAATYCTKCFADWQADRFCPVCLVTYAEDQDDIKMVACDVCDRWVHIECDPTMNEARYTCPCCLPDAWIHTSVARQGRRPVMYKGHNVLV